MAVPGQRCTWTGKLDQLRQHEHHNHDSSSIPHQQQPASRGRKRRADEMTSDDQDNPTAKKRCNGCSYAHRSYLRRYSWGMIIAEAYNIPTPYGRRTAGVHLTRNDGTLITAEVRIPNQEAGGAIREECDDDDYDDDDSDDDVDVTDDEEEEEEEFEEFENLVAVENLFDDDDDDDEDEDD